MISNVLHYITPDSRYLYAGFNSDIRFKTYIVACPRKAIIFLSSIFNNIQYSKLYNLIMPDIS